MTAEQILASVEASAEEVGGETKKIPTPPFHCMIRTVCVHCVAMWITFQISPSNIFAIASILEGAHYINGSPQNTLVPGIIELAQKVGTLPAALALHLSSEKDSGCFRTKRFVRILRLFQHNVFVGGDDFKSGQTKIKSALVDFLVSSGLKPESIVSYNHLGNNDGKNLSEARQFRSKVDPPHCGKEHYHFSENSNTRRKSPSHRLSTTWWKRTRSSIQLVKSRTTASSSSTCRSWATRKGPWTSTSAGGSSTLQFLRRVLTRSTSSIFMGGLQTFVIHNTCEDSLLATPLIYDLAILTELATRIRYSDSSTGQFHSFHEVTWSC